MGLDMYAYKVERKPANTDFHYEDKKPKEIYYWRKHHDLHGWMENLYYEKGGTANEFNCTPIRLTIEDLEQLEDDILNYNLPHTEGFFFGHNPPDEDSIKDDLQFIKKARACIEEGYDVYYDSWW